LIAIGFLVLGIIPVALGFYRLIGGRKVLEIVLGKEFIETLELFLSKDKEKKKSPSFFYLSFLFSKNITVLYKILFKPFHLE